MTQNDADGDISSHRLLVNKLLVHVLPHPICVIWVICGHLNPHRWANKLFL